MTYEEEKTRFHLQAIGMDASYVIVMSDEFSYEYYPVFVYDSQSLDKEINKHRTGSQGMDDRYIEHFKV